MAQDEIFRTIEGFEQYQISNLGRIVSNKYGKSKFLKAQKDAIGYFHVRLFPKDPIYGFYDNGRGMIPKLEKIHRLVADAFIPKPEGDYVLQVNHKDGNKENNDVTNLEWVTAEENMQHSWEIGLRDNSAWKAAVHRRKPAKAIYPDGTEEYFLSRIHAAISNGINPPVVFNSIHNNRPVMKGVAKGIQFFDTKSLPEGKMWREIANIEQMLLEYREKFYGKYQKAYRKKWYAEYKANKKKNNEKN